MDRFNCFIPLEFEKASSKKKEDKYKNMVFWSMASDNSEDSDGEMLEPSGYDLSTFLKSGKINLEHFTSRKGDAYYWIGEPIDAKIKNNQLFIKGKLWSEHPLARNFYDVVDIMEKSGSTRKAGMSIEGSVIKRDPNNPKRVLKAKINNVAVTMSPKNSNSFLDLVKGNYDEAYIEPENDNPNGGGEFILELDRGDGTTLTIDKKFNVKIIKKAITAGSQTGRDLTDVKTSGASLKKESLKKKLIKLEPDFIKSVKWIAANKDKLSDKSLEIIKNKIKSLLS